MNAFIQTLGIKHPLIQAPMAGVSTPEMAAAVSNAGALGSIAIGATHVEGARAMIERTFALTQNPFNVNVFCHAPAVRDDTVEKTWLQYLAPHFAKFGAKPPAQLNEIYKSFVEDDAMLELLLALQPRVVSFHFGLPPQNKIDALRKAGIFLMATATNLKEATQIEFVGIDAIVVQGIEAGGHRGMFDPAAEDESLSTFDLVQILAQNVKIPVIAAGGLMHGRDVKTALELGASAAQLGTAFILAPESAADAAYRSALLSNKAFDTRLTDVISGRPARGLVNDFMQLCDTDSKPRVPAYPVTYDAGKALNAAAKADGNPEYAAQWAGTGAPLARPMDAAAMVETLVREIP